MSLKFSAFIVMLITITDGRKPIITDEFDIVSTTQRPPEIQKLTDQIFKLEQQIQYGETLKENNRRLNILESQTSQIQNTLNSMNVQIAAVQKSLEKLANSLPRAVEKSLETLSKSPLTQHNTSLPTDCQEVQKTGNKVSGMYLIQPKYSPQSFMVLCDMDTKGGGWTYFLNRYDGSQDFYLNWTDYKKGFGSLTGEFWLGLAALHQLTGYEANELLVELVDFEGKTAHALYNAFAVGNEREGYPIKILGAYSGDAGDSLRYQAGMKFTTQDRDQDARDTGNCAIHEKGSWWYNSCTHSNLAAKYLKGNVSSSDEWRIMYWLGFRGTKYSLKEARMMVRPRDSYSSSVLPNKNL